MRAILRRRSGMTLIELLVVIAILGALAVAVLPNIANTAESRRSREAARIVSSFIAKSQSRAIGRTEWAGCMFVPLGAAGLQGAAAADLYLADVPAAYRGDTTDAKLTVSATSTARRTLTVSPAIPLTTGTVFDLIRFDGRGSWYELATMATGSTTIDIRLLGFEDSNSSEDLGYVARNTPWPADGVPHTFEITRQPVPSGSPLSLADGRVVDLSWSGFGPPFVNTVTTTFVRFATAGERIALLFDGTGRLRQIVAVASASTGSPRWVPTGPVFLLVGRIDRAGQSSATLNPADDSVGANWQYSDSYWIGIDVMSGVCKTAECKPNPVGADDLAKLIDSQTYIRQALLKGGL